MKFNVDSFKRYFSNTIWSLFDQSYSRLLALFINIAIARQFGVEEYGIYSYAISIVGLFSFIVNMGLDDIIVRELVLANKDRKEILGTALLLKGLGAFIFLIALLSLIFYLDESSMTVQLIFIFATIAILQIFSVFELYFQATVQLYLTAISRIFTTTILLSLTLLYFYLQASIVVIAGLQITTTLLFIIILCILYSRQESFIFQWRAKLPILKEIFSESWPLMFSLVLVSIYIHCDKVIITWLLGSSATGIYSAASKLSEGWFFVPTVIVGSLMPAIINFKRSNTNHYYKRLQDLFDIMVLIAILVALVITFIAEDLISLLYGDDYINASSVLIVHIWSGVLIFLGNASGKWMIIEGLSKLYFYRTIAGVIVNIIGNFLLIPEYGILGAAYATLISQFIVVILFDALNRETRICLKMKLKALFLPRLLMIKE
jgi:O-antigen/teichoic acid export membrane protein